MQESTVTIKGQTTLPKDVRAALQLGPGDRLRYLILDGGEVRIVRSQPVARLAGLLKDAGLAKDGGLVKDRAAGPVTLEEMDAAIARGAAGG